MDTLVPEYPIRFYFSHSPSCGSLPLGQRKEEGRGRKKASSPEAGEGEWSASGIGREKTEK